MSNKNSNYSRSRSKLTPRHPDNLSHRTRCQECIKASKAKAAGKTGR